MSMTPDEYKEYYQHQMEESRRNEKLALAIFKNIADRFDERGHFLQKFAIMFVNASEKNKKCLFPAAHKLIEEYNLEAEQKLKGVLHAAQYM